MGVFGVCEAATARAVLAVVGTRWHQGGESSLGARVACHGDNVTHHRDRLVHGCTPVA